MEISGMRFEAFIRDSVTVDLIRNYVKTHKYIDRDTLLLLLGGREEKENGI